MPRIDESGVKHPTRDDEITVYGMYHVAHCERCRAEFPEVAEASQAALDWARLRPYETEAGIQHDGSAYP